MATVYAPNPRHDGTTASVKFRDGKAEVDSAYLLDWFRRHGYTVEGDTQQPTQGPEPESAADQAPNRSDPKDAWVEHAVRQGADRGEAEGLSKTDLVELYG